MAPTVTALVNQKGGVAKSTSCINLGAALVQEGKRVLLVDTDPQASMTIALGNQQPDNLPITMADLMAKVMNDQQLTPGEGILHHSEGMDLLPSSIALAGTEVSLVNAMSRESTLKFLLNDYRKDYDHILIDCMPSLGMLTINALAAANRVIIPVQANYLSAKGLEQLLQTISKVRRQINPKLQIDGILLTGDSADPWDRPVTRSGMDNLLELPILSMPFPDAIRMLREQRVMFVTVGKRKAVPVEQIPAGERIAVLISGSDASAASLLAVSDIVCDPGLDCSDPTVMGEAAAIIMYACRNLKGE